MDNPRFAPYVDRFGTAGCCMDEVFIEFSARDTAEKRFDFTRKLMEQHGLLPDAVHELRDYECTLYDVEKACEFRRKGVEVLKTENYPESLIYHTESIKSSKPGTVNHGYSLGCRAIVMFNTEQYHLCLKDIRRAMLSKYPADVSYKMYQLKGNAESMLGYGDLARESYSKCMELINKNPVMCKCDEQNLKTQIANAIKRCDSLKEQKVVENHVDHLLGGSNDKIPALSECLELKYSRDMGRGVYATCNINPGDVVAIDEPYIGSRYMNNVYRCYYYDCSNEFEEGVHCPKCLLVSFCNEECMHKSNLDGHTLECSIMYSMGTIPGKKKVNRLALKWFLKESSKMGIEKYCSFVKNLMKTKIDLSTKGFDENGQFKSDSFLAAFCLENNENKMPMDALFFFNCNAVEILQYLILSGFEIPDHHLATVGASLVHMINVLDKNCRWFKLHGNLLDKKWAQSEPCVLYPSICLFNHSCDPNVTRCSKTGLLSGRKIVLKAVQHIPKGHQLFVSYGPNFKQTEKISRQEYLMNRYLFKCVCKPCLEDWPSYLQYPPNSLTALHLLNSSMSSMSRVQLKCFKFAEFKNTIHPRNFHHHLNYLYSFSKFMFDNVSRPCLFHSDCVEMIITAHKNIHMNIRD